MDNNYAIPKGSTVLITGVTGFIGSHVAGQLIDLGYIVRGTVRDTTKAQWITEYFHSKYDAKFFSTVLVPEYNSPGAYDHVMEGVAGVIHTASDVSMPSDPNVIIPPVVNGVKNAISAAAAHPTIKRFVLTSSSTALASPVADTKRQLDVRSWNDWAVKEAWQEPHSPEKSYTVYSASKTESERAAWKFVDDHKPGFVLNSVCPDYNIGPVLHPSQPGSTAAMTKALYAAAPGMVGYFKTAFIPRHEVDVRDVASLHVAALLYSDVQNERLLAYNQPVGYDELVQAFKKVNPAWNKLEPGVPWRDLTTVDCSRSLELLKRLGRNGWIPTEESVKECVL